MLSDLPLARTTHPRFDRDALSRTSSRRLAELRDHPGARCLVVTPRAVAVREVCGAGSPAAPATQGSPVLALDAPAVRDVLARIPALALWDGEAAASSAPAAPAPDSDPDTPQPDPSGPVERDSGLAYLGLVDGAPLFAALLLDGEEAHAAVLTEHTMAGLREAAVDLDDVGADAATAATALAGWHASHPRCPRCGAPTAPREGGWMRLCPSDLSQHFPRTDPAVIMAITDGEDRVLLGRSAAFPEHRYSCLAGFVESGESAENAVRREVAEEAGVAVGDVDYLGSQPWPFPRSLMLAYRGRTVEHAPVPRPDGVEMVDARFFSRADLTAACASGEVVLPGGASIARAILTQWYGGALPDSAR